MRKPNIRIHLRRAMAAALAGVMSVSLSVSALAAGLGYTPGCPLCDPSVSGNARPSASFSDVPDTHPFHDAIMWCAEQGIVGGYSDGTFRPANTVSNANFSVMLSRAFYANDVAKYDTPSIRQGGTFMPNYYAMDTNGAFENVSFHTQYQYATTMNKGISRYDMAMLMTNIMNSKGFAASSSDKNAAISKIADYSEIPSQYRDAVLNVYALGIIGGYSNGTFGGTVTMNRGQAAIVIYRMMQFSGNSSSGSGNITNPDPETPVDPATGEVVCACVRINGKLCEICHTAEQGTTTPVTPTPNPNTPVTPEIPETPTGRTLSNGKAITEANVTEILNQLQATYPRKTSFASGYGGLGSGRAPSKNCIKQITDRYAVHNIGTGQTGGPGSISTTSGCAGWAAFVEDEIFGQTGVTWKKTSIANARPGDLMIILDDDGTTAIHVEVYVKPSTDGFAKTQEVYVTSASPNSSGVYTIGWGNDTRPSTNAIDVYTAYPN